jgi:hypothetical protein
MKKQLTTAISKAFCTALFVVFVSLSQSAYALPDSSINKEAEVTYQGLNDRKLMFNVSYRNESADPLQLTIKNDLGEIIYSRQFESKPLNKTMLFSEFPENSKLTFVITAGKKEMSQTFQINAEVKTVEEFVVKGL